jgi:hypothetical protein
MTTPTPLTLATRLVEHRRMRWLRADAFWVLVAATVATFTAALWTQSAPLRLIGSLLATLVVVVLTRWAIIELRRWGARPTAVAVVALLGLLAVALQIVPLVLTMDWIRASLIVVAWGGLLVGYVAPELVVRLTGGPRAAWSLLRERAALGNDVRRMTDAEFAAAGDVITARVQALDRYRTPTTNEYIDVFQRLSLADEPVEAKRQQAARLAEMERELLRSLGPSPAWAAELGAGAPAAR